MVTRNGAQSSGRVGGGFDYRAITALVTASEPPQRVSCCRSLANRRYYSPVDDISLSRFHAGQYDGRILHNLQFVGLDS